MSHKIMKNSKNSKNGQKPQKTQKAGIYGTIYGRKRQKGPKRGKKGGISQGGPGTPFFGIFLHFL